MNIATIDDFDKVWGIFQDNKEWFPHVWNTKIKKRIANGEVVFENDVVITYSIYKRNNKIENLTALKNECILHQIVAKYRNGSARKTIEDFFKFVNTPVWLTVRSENITACNFYKKVGMREVGKTSWSNGNIQGLIYKKELNL